MGQNKRGELAAYRVTIDETYNGGGGKNRGGNHGRRNTSL